MRHLRASLIALSLLASPGLSPVLAQPTSTGSVSLQGKLTGVADGSQPLTFFLHTAQTGGTQVASIGPITTQVTGGVFSTTVPIAASTFDGRTLWWSVSVNGGPATARQLVTSVPYAANAQSLASHITVQGRGVGVNGTGDDANALSVYGTNPGSGVVVVRGDADIAGGSGFAQQIAVFAKDSALNLPGLSLRMGLNTLRGIGQINTPNYDLYLNESSGNVVIGTIGTASASKLHVGGDVRCTALTITGGSDLAEPFTASPMEAHSVKPEPGMVMSIDPDHPGALRVATAAYDTKVAGVYSGANGLPTGLVMGKEGCKLTAPGDDKLPLAMTGRVWVYADESGGTIKPGDRLTTSGDKPGHAIKVRDEARSIGAVIGKAMTNVDPKTGMVLVLVNLQ